MADLEVVPPDDNVVAWRLGRVEKTLEEIGRKLDVISDLKEVQIKQGKDIEYLLKSRERMIGALTIMGTSLGVLIINRLAEVM